MRQNCKHHSQMRYAMISAGLTETLVEEAREANVFTVLSKPVRFDQITSTVNRAMEYIYNWPTDA